MGISSMKIWPFVFSAEASQGQFISPTDLKKPYGHLKKSKKNTGIVCRSVLNSTESGIFPNHCHLPSLDDMGVRWIEDPVFLTNPVGIQELKRTVRSRIAWVKPEVVLKISKSFSTRELSRC
ncbi:MAG: hypothetical protein Ct9H300mP13_7510 [Gammaproteobacteria bacterium]|nr:MAG: hypothetical protein Ct9H300mP13_7510 [Gammaproteobacteria bacterium]